MGQAQSGQGGFPGQGQPGGDKKDQVRKNICIHDLRSIGFKLHFSAQSCFIENPMTFMTSPLLQRH